MRRLVWLAAGFSGAAALAEYLLPADWLPLLAAVTLAAAGVLFLCARSRPGLRARGTALLLSASAGLTCWWGWYRLRVLPCEAMAGQVVTLTARVTDWPREEENYIRLSVTALGGMPRTRGYLYIYEDPAELPALSPGTVVTCEVKLQSAFTRGEDRVRTFTADGRFFRGTVRGELAAASPAGPGLYFPRYLARAVSRACEELFGGREGIFMRALTTGDRQALYADTELYGEMRAAGMLHAVAVSGMHVFVLTAMLQFLLGRGRRSALLCLPVLVLFALMCGASASVTRAVVMQGLCLCAPLFHREADGPSALAAALLLLLLLNPMSIGGIGLQLSFLCMLGFLLVMPRLTPAVERLCTFLRRRADRRLRRAGNRAVRVGARLTEGAVRLVGGVLSAVAASVSATVFSAPLAAVYFGTVPVLSPLANLLTLPVIELLFAGGYLVCGAYALFPALGRWLAGGLVWGVRWCLFVFRQLARVPFVCLYAVDPGAVAWLVFVYATAAAWLMLRRGGRRVSPAIPGLLVLAGLGLALLRPGLALRLGRREMAVLDVGQGACTTLYDAGSSAVVDCGGLGLDDAGEVAADYLRSVGVPRVDVLVLTHLDSDHVNGVETLLCRLPVGMIVFPAWSDYEDAAEILGLAERYGARVVTPVRACDVSVGALTLSLFPTHGSGNDRGLVVRAVYPGVSAYIMGDAGAKAERELLAAGDVADADILVAGHHGSAGSSSALFLRAVQAETAVISVGRNNSYGLPAEAAMDRLLRYCETIYRTDEDGSVVISLRGDPPAGNS